jgi:hypothetical protein
MTLDEICFLVLGGSFAIAGLVLLARSGRGSSETEIVVPGLGKLTGPTAVTLAIVLTFLGYHTAAYGGPVGLLSFRVSPRFGWLVYVGGVLAVVGAMAADRIDRRA